MKKIVALIAFWCCYTFTAYGQFLMDMLDTTKEAGKGLLGIYQKYDHLRIGGYIQPQFQLAESEGVKSFEGGDFSQKVSNRFMLRRSRIKIDYLHNNNQDQPGVQIVFQFDANERSFSVRDVWGRVFENRFKLFSFTIGMFARPFGYEVNLSSSDRENPERGRMSQILMRSERDLGAMISFDVRRDSSILKRIKFDIGLFNGQGINASGDFDNRKDLICRASLKPWNISRKLRLSAGISYLYGGLLQNTPYYFATSHSNGVATLFIDSAPGNLGRYSPRIYRGADVQLKIKNRIGFTELRGEYIEGTQTGTASSSETPTALMHGTDAFYRRKFNGAYFYFLQHLGSLQHQLVIKYDWYDPNTQVAGSKLAATAPHPFTAADIKYHTWQVGYNYAVHPSAKLSLFYAFVVNEATSLPGYQRNLPDNVLTTRLQFRF